MINPHENLQPGDALLVVDVQRDFCPGGAMAVPEGHQVVPVLNRWIEAAEEKKLQIYASRDWHPKRHISFRQQGGPWPPHCVQDSEGARFHDDLQLPDSTLIVTKGVRFDHDQNSAFDATGLDDQLRRDWVRRLWIGGLALDVCVLQTVLAARRLGFEVHVIEEATRPVDSEEGESAKNRMKETGATVH